MPDAPGPGGEALGAREAAEQWLRHDELVEVYGCFCMTGDDGEPLPDEGCSFCESVDSLAALLEARDRAAFERGWREGAEAVREWQAGLPGGAPFTAVCRTIRDNPPPAGGQR